jgi:hypothetical protein
MKKITLLFLVVLSITQFGYSCDCIGANISFCDEVSSINEDEIVARIQIVSREGLGGKAQILYLYKGVEEKKVIQIWGGGGGDCSIVLGRVGQILIMKIGRITQNYPYSPEMKIGDYKSGGVCSNTTLIVENGKIQGRISKLIKSNIIDDDDPKSLSFCSIFESDAQELESVKISPNPTSDNLTIRGLRSSVIVSIFDYMGKLLSEEVISPSNNNVSFINFANGLYIIRFRRNNAIKGLKIVKN